MAGNSTAKRSAWKAVPLYHPFLLLIVGPVPALGLAVWNAYHLRSPGLRVQMLIALGFALFVSVLSAYAVTPAAFQLSIWTGLPVDIAKGLVRTALIFVAGLAIVSLTMRQLVAYKMRLFSGPVPTESLRLVLTFLVIAAILSVIAHRADLPLVSRALFWVTPG